MIEIKSTTLKSDNGYKLKQSRISKIESSYDDEISLKELLDYGKALKLQLEIGYRQESSKIVDLIKYHAFKINDYLEQLTRLVKNDEDLAKGILKFHFEAFANLSNFTLKNIPELYEKIGKESIKEHKNLGDKLQKQAVKT